MTNSLLKAIAAVQNGMKYQEASEKYGVPVTTTHDKVVIERGIRQKKFD